jgi:GTP-binding protein
VKVRSAEFVTTCVSPAQCPPPGLPEIALLGRSNVGKSSLLNRLAGRKQLARTSATPGKTRAIHFFRIELERAEFLLVDLPGYGWARVSRRERESWQRLVEGYLEDRAPLRAALLLQDLRRDVSDDETLLLDWLAERRIRALVALTKVDKLKPMRRAARVRALSAQLAGTREPPTLIATSAQAGTGIDDLRRTLARLV